MRALAALRMVWASAAVCEWAVSTRAAFEEF
jgi:hypothetical protein